MVATLLENKSKPRPIIAKFVRRDVKAQLMRNKKHLRNKGAHRHTFINGDLTRLRSLLVCKLRKDQAVTKVWTIDGKIFYLQKEDNKEVNRTIDSADDLFKLGWSEEKVRGTGIYLDL